MSVPETLVVTGASGHLGRLVLAELHRLAPQSQRVGVVRKMPSSAAAGGAVYRVADYTDPASLDAAFAGAGKLLLISSSEVGQRLVQHRNVIDSAKSAGVKLVVYTSILHADRSPMALATEHRQTEDYLRASGLPHVILRNGWYTENYTATLGATLQHGAVIGAAGTGRIAAAARADFAAAAATVLAADANAHAGRVYELAGDRAFTLGELAGEIARQSGKPIIYRDLGEDGYKKALQDVGLPAGFAGLLADSDAKAATGSLFDDSGSLSRLIGRPSTSLSASVAAALATA